MKNSAQFILDGNISPENVEFYNDYGYLIASGIVSPNEVDILKKDTAKIFRGEHGAIEGLMPVTPDETDADVLKKYVAIHFPHKISPVIKDFLFQEKIVNVLKNVV